VPDASTFRVFGCAVFAKVLGNLIRKLGLNSFRGVMVGYSQNSHDYRVYNPATRRITTSVHAKFHESVPGFGTSHHVDSSIDVFFDANDSPDATSVSPPAELSHDDVDIVDTPSDSARPVLAHIEDYVANVSTMPRVCVTDACSSDFSMMVAHPRHTSTEGPVVDVALVSSSVCVELASYHAALISPQFSEWLKAM
jgi:hypothetical protein